MPDSGDSSRLDDIATRWSLIAQAREGSPAMVGEARGALVLRVRRAPRRYIAAIVDNREDAEDLMQDVFVRLMGGDFCGADPSRGRFRDLLKVSLRNMAQLLGEEQAAANRRLPPGQSIGSGRRPGGRSVDHHLAAASARLGMERLTAEGAVAAGKRTLHSSPPASRSSRGHFRGTRPATFAEALQGSLSAALRQQLRRARMQFADLLITEIGQGLSDPTPKKIQEELLALGLLEYLHDLLPPEWIAP